MLSISKEKLAEILLFILLLLIFIDVEPFHIYKYSMMESSEGNIKRQIAYLLVCLPSILIAFIYSNRFRLQFKKELIILFLLLWCFLSIAWSDTPSISFRRLVATILIVYSIMSLLCMMTNQENLLKILLWTSGITIFINYIGILFLPKLSIIQSGSQSGLWKGLHEGKNIAGNVSAIFTIMWFWAGLIFPKWKKYFWLVSLLCLVFLFNTASKTSIIVLFLSFIITYSLWKGVRNLINFSFLLWFVATISIIGIAILSFVSFDEIILFVFNDARYLGFTGRTDVWAYLIEHIIQHPLLGVGYEAFWTVGENSRSLGISVAWAQETVHGHQGYLDILTTIGIPGFILIILFMFSAFEQIFVFRKAKILPVFMFYNILIFSLIYNLTESTLLHKYHFMWVLMLISIFQLRINYIQRKTCYEHPHRS